MKRKPWHKSTTFWFAFWAAGIVTYVVIKNPANAIWASSVVGLCSAIVLTYLGGNKAVDFRHGPEMIDEIPKKPDFGQQ